MCSIYKMLKQVIAEKSCNEALPFIGFDSKLA